MNIQVSSGAVLVSPPIGMHAVKYGQQDHLNDEYRFRFEPISRSPEEVILIAQRLENHKENLKELTGSMYRYGTYRMENYYTNRPESLEQYKKTFYKSQIILMPVGIGTMCFSGACTGALVSSYTTGNPISGGIVGGVVGACTGAFAGHLFSYPLTTFKVSYSQEYIRYSRDVLDSRIGESFSQIFTEDTVLRECTCPITHEIFIIPVKAPDGKIYEQSEIVRWITEHPKMDRNDPEYVPNSPIRACDIDLDDLTIDLPMFEKVAMRIKTIVVQDMENLVKYKILSSNIASFMNVRTAKYREIFRDLFECVREQHINKVITSDQRDAEELKLQTLKTEILRQEF